MPFIKDKNFHSEDHSIEEDVQNGCEIDVEEEEIVLPPAPEERSPFVGMKDTITYWGFSQQGESHKKNDAPCQDRCAISISEHDHPIMIAAIADGVGSCVLSHYGSAIATESAVQFLKDQLDHREEELDDQWTGALLREAMYHALDSVSKAAYEMEQLEYSFQSTLTLAVYDQGTLYIAHAGDDGVVVLTSDGTIELVTSRMKGEEASSVYPLQAGPKFWQIFKVDRDVCGFVMATDGVLDAFVRGKTEENRIYYPFIQPIFETSQEHEEHVKEVQEFYYQYMSSETYREKVTDDLTILAVVDQSRLNKDVIPVFDEKKWEKQTHQYREKVKAALYPDQYQKKRVCPECGFQVEEGKRFCSNCGLMLKHEWKVGSPYAKDPYKRKPKEETLDYLQVSSQERPSLQPDKAMEKQKNVSVIKRIKGLLRDRTHLQLFVLFVMALTVLILLGVTVRSSLVTWTIFHFLRH